MKSNQVIFGILCLVLAVLVAVLGFAKVSFFVGQVSVNVYISIALAALGLILMLKPARP